MLCPLIQLKNPDRSDGVSLHNFIFLENSLDKMEATKPTSVVTAYFVSKRTIIDYKLYVAPLLELSWNAWYNCLISLNCLF